MRAQGGELVRGGNEGKFRFLGDPFRHFIREFRVAVQARADGRPAQGQFQHSGEAGFDALNRLIELGDIPGEFLPKRQRNGVHQMGPADFDDRFKFLLFDDQRIPQLLHARDQPMGDLLDGGNVHGCRERVVGRLGHVDIVVRMHRGFRPHHPVREFDGPVGDHLVDVHVRLRAAAGLPDPQGKMVVEFTRDHLICRLADEFHLCSRFDVFFLEQPELQIHLGGRFFEDSKRPDD